jgi:hypothetical protein
MNVRGDLFYKKIGYAIELPGRKSSALGAYTLEKVGGPPPSSGFSGRRGPFKYPKTAISGPEALLPNLKYAIANDVHPTRH